MQLVNSKEFYLKTFKWDPVSVNIFSMDMTMKNA